MASRLEGGVATSVRAAASAGGAAPSAADAAADAADAAASSSWSVGLTVAGGCSDPSKKMIN